MDFIVLRKEKFALCKNLMPSKLLDESDPP